jgi:hypothetical protein
MNDTRRDNHRPQPKVLQVPEFPQLLCRGEEILERAQGIQQTYAEVLRSLVGDIAEVANWNAWEAHEPHDNANPPHDGHFTEIDSPK